MKKAVAILIMLSTVFCLFSCSENGSNDLTNELTEKLAEIVSGSVESTTEENVPDVSATENPLHNGLSATPTVSAVVTADFGFRMLKQAVSQQTNALISPVSLINALAMTANGASGKTLEEMERVLGASVETLNKNFSADTFKADGVKLANSVWFKNDSKSLTVNDTFVDTVQKHYGAEMFGKEFDNETVKDINRWVSKNTDGLINNMLSEIPDEAVIYLINTVLFDAEWEYPYYSNDVLENQTFTAESGEKQTVTMLSSAGNSWNYFGLGKAEGIVRNYKNGYSFAAILPYEGVSISAALESFTGSDFVKAVTPIARGTTCGTGIYPINIRLPKFEFECKFKLSDALISMGMPTAFSEKDADFTSMGTSWDGNIFIGEVYHNTYISLTEKGTKAGAATAVEMVKEGMPYYEKTIEFNRPFIYVIYETETGAPLFIGTVRDFKK